MIFIFASLINFSHAGQLRDWWDGFCERHLIAEDPYQYEHLSIDQIVTVYYRHKSFGHKSKALSYEIEKRLKSSLSRDDREILAKLEGK